MTDNKENDEVMDEMMLVISNFDDEELDKFAKLRGMTKTEWQQIIAAWKADRLQ